MCLNNSVEATKRLRGNGKGKIICYKIVTCNHGGMYSSVMMNHNWKPGWNKSNRPIDKLLPVDCLDVYQGMHVYLNLEYASTQHQYHFNNDSHTILAVTCYLKDLIAVNHTETEAVFQKVWVGKQDYQDAKIGKLNNVFKFYKRGSRFKIYSEEYILAGLDYRLASLISLKTGNRWTNPVTVQNSQIVTAKEFEKICGGQRSLFEEVI